jgi:predicted GTPase
MKNKQQIENEYEYTNHGPFRVRLSDSELVKIFDSNYWEKVEKICDEIEKDPKLQKVRESITNAIKNIKLVSFDEAKAQIEKFNKKD